MLGRQKEVIKHIENHVQMPVTCMGVPDNKILRLHERAANA